MNDLELSEAVRTADPFARMTPQQAERTSASAFARAELRTARVWPRRVAVAFALVLSSAAMAALARRVAAEPAVEHETTRRLPLPSRGEGGGEGAERSANHNAVDSPPARPPHPVPLPARGEGTLVQTQQDGLGEEARLLLTALRQLRVDGDRAAAVQTLDEYDRKFPEGALRHDADAARLEAQSP